MTTATGKPRLRVVMAYGAIFGIPLEPIRTWECEGGGRRARDLRPEGAYELWKARRSWWFRFKEEFTSWFSLV